MLSPEANTLPKEERLCGKSSISALISAGRWGSSAHIRYCWTDGNGHEYNRLMVSVPKKRFKRAVKRNLLKRRMREAYRTQKGLLTARGIDFMLAWVSGEIADFETVKAEVASVLARIGKASLPKTDRKEAEE